MTKKKSKKEPGLAEAFEKLEKITAEFESGEVDLEKGIPKFKEGLKLARYLKSRLSKIENEIKEVKAEFEDLEGEGLAAQEIEPEPEEDVEPEDISF